MKRLIPALAVVLALACLPANVIPGLSTPTAEIQATSTFASTPTEIPLPSETPIPPSPTASATFEPAVVESTATALPLLNSTATFAFVTSTDFPADIVSSATATLASGQPTLTPTLGILKHGTLPPSVPYTTITLVNWSKRQAYISLQVTTIEGYYTIIEYPVAGKVKVKVPLGSYVYVAWVGGKQMAGSFHLSASESIVITLYKDKVTVR